MTVLLYDYWELEERTSKHFKTWKACHICIYALIAIFGIVNYSFLQGTLQLYNDNCILYPRKLEFHEVEIPCFDKNDPSKHDDTTKTNGTVQSTDAMNTKGNGTAQSGNNTSVNKSMVNNENNGTAHTTDEVDQGTNTTTPIPQAANVNISNSNNEKSREYDESKVQDKEILEECDGNGTSWHRLALDMDSTLFGENDNCQWALYTPLVSTIFAAVWMTMFLMCPGGGRVRAGLQQPWRILGPALVFAAIMAILTGHSFSLTSGGLHAFCAGFANLTNTTECSPVSWYSEGAWNATMGVGTRTAVTRAAGAGVWAWWACAGALLLARCLAAPDFAVRRTKVLLRDPQQRITKRLKKSPKKHHVQFAVRPGSPKDDASIRSEPTLTSELVTASVEQHDGSALSSVFNTPVKRTDERDSMLEMWSLPHIDDKTTPDQYQ